MKQLICLIIILSFPLGALAFDEPNTEAQIQWLRLEIDKLQTAVFIAKLIEYKQAQIDAGGDLTLVIPSEEDELIKWLSWCESRDNPFAINPKDTNGLPSFGRFQFQLKTFRKFTSKYGFIDAFEKPMDYIFDGFLQEKLVRLMWNDGIDFSGEFPTCYKKWLINQF